MLCCHVTNSKNDVELCVIILNYWKFEALELGQLQLFLDNILSILMKDGDD